MEIVKQPFAAAMVDVMGGCDRWEVRIGEHGLCALVDVMPRLVPAGRTADVAIVQAARTSTGQGTKAEAADRDLQRYLYRNQHTTPFEMVNLKFHHVLPIFVARQLIRHRTASVNEYSLRYAEAKDRFWFPTPDGLRAQGTTSKQHTEGSVDLACATAFVDHLHAQSREEMRQYETARDGGIGRELARVCLPVNLMTEWYWELDLKNLLHFLGLRQDKHAQAEIRDYADAMYALIQPLVPVAVEAYDDYHPLRGGLQLSALDLRALAAWNRHDGAMPDLGAIFTNTRELSEFGGKVARMGHKLLEAHAVAAVDARRAVEKG